MGSRRTIRESGGTKAENENKEKGKEKCNNIKIHDTINYCYSTEWEVRV